MSLGCTWRLPGCLLAQYYAIWGTVSDGTSRAGSINTPGSAHAAFLHQTAPLIHCPLVATYHSTISTTC